MSNFVFVNLIDFIELNCEMTIKDLINFKLTKINLFFFDFLLNDMLSDCLIRFK